MLNIGCHLSISKGFLAIGQTAISIGANTFQFFSRNPRGRQAKVIYPADAAALRELMAKNNFAPVLAHAPYTLNACSVDKKTREFALLVLADDLMRMEFLPGNYYNFHPGSHTGQGAAEGIRLTAAALNEVLTPAQNTTVLLESMAGSGSEIGKDFGELARIIDGVEQNDKIGVCLDTCHIYTAGYDIVNDLDGVIREFDQTVGLRRLKAIHLNDSLMPLGSHRDRHQQIGKGTIGFPAFTRIINHPALRDLPFYLETPGDLASWEKEISMLRAAYAR